MEGVRKRGKVITIAALLVFVIAIAGCVQSGQNAQQTGQNNQIVNTSTTPSAPPDQQLQPEFNDHLDEALAELEETR